MLDLLILEDTICALEAECYEKRKKEQENENIYIIVHVKNVSAW